jgi:hypothetical protein
MARESPYAGDKRGIIRFPILYLEPNPGLFLTVTVAAGVKQLATENDGMSDGKCRYCTGGMKLSSYRGAQVELVLIGASVLASRGTSGFW